MGMGRGANCLLPGEITLERRVEAVILQSAYCRYEWTRTQLARRFDCPRGSIDHILRRLVLKGTIERIDRDGEEAGFLARQS